MATGIRRKGALTVSKAKTWELSYREAGTGLTKTKQITTVTATESRILVAYNSISNDDYFKAVKMSLYS